MEDLFKSNPLQYACDLIDKGRTSESDLLAACLKFMSHDQIRDMLKENELDPDFLEGYYGEEEISKEERFACEMYNERYSYCY